jgi:hypothetical protein
MAEIKITGRKVWMHRIRIFPLLVRSGRHPIT